MKKALNEISKIFLLLFLLIIVGFIMVYYAYKINFNNIENNLKRSFDNNYSLNYLTSDYYKANMNSLNFTEGIMISSILIKEKNPIISLAKNKHVGRLELMDIINGFEPKKITNYSRYWHGYILPLKILLNFFTLTEIRLLLFFFFVILIIYIAINMYKNNLQSYILPFITSILITFPMFTYGWLSNDNLYISLTFSLFLLIFNKKLNKNLKYIYLIFGAITSYYDLLTIPLLNLCYPLILTILLNDKKNLKENIKDIIILSIYWGIGYIGMWVGKWIISSMVLHENIFYDAYLKIKERTFNNGNNISYLRVIKSLFRYLFNNFTILMIILNLYVIGIKLIRIVLKNKIIKKKFNPIFISLMIIALFPFLWFFVVREHSFEHSFYTYKILSISFVSFFIAINKFLNDLIE